MNNDELLKFNTLDPNDSMIIYMSSLLDILKQYQSKGKKNFVSDMKDRRFNRELYYGLLSLGFSYFEKQPQSTIDDLVQITLETINKITKRKEENKYQDKTWII